MLNSPIIGIKNIPENTGKNPKEANESNRSFLFIGVLKKLKIICIGLFGKIGLYKYGRFAIKGLIT